MKDLNLREQFIKQRAAGRSYASISESLNISKTTLVKWGKKYDAEISSAKENYLKELIEQYELNRQAKLQNFCSLLDKAKEELKLRDFKKISTEKLLDMTLKLYDTIESEGLSDKGKLVVEEVFVPLPSLVSD